MYIELFEKFIFVSLNLNLGAIPKGGPASSKLEKFPSLIVLKRGFLQQFLDDFRAIMIYDDPSSQRVSKSVIKTENTNLTMP